jgi:hypothetical protein
MKKLLNIKRSATYSNTGEYVATVNGYKWRVFRPSDAPHLWAARGNQPHESFTATSLIKLSARLIQHEGTVAFCNANFRVSA